MQERLYKWVPEKCAARRNAAGDQGVGNGEAIFSPSIALLMIDYFSQAHAAAVPQAFPELSDWEREILDLKALGHKNSEIGKDCN